jgi:hypothetical protein
MKAWEILINSSPVKLSRFRTVPLSIYFQNSSDPYYDSAK